MAKDTGFVASTSGDFRAPWASFVAVVASVLFLAACCCNPCPPSGSQQKPVHPGYGLKKVRFYNAGTRPVIQGMVTRMSSDLTGTSNFVLHNNWWPKISPAATVERSAEDGQKIRSYKLSFGIKENDGTTTPITVVATRPEQITNQDDVGWCFAELQDYAQGPLGCRLKLQFEYRRGNDNTNLYTDEWYVVPGP
jgi:hypothetical protein